MTKAYPTSEKTIKSTQKSPSSKRWKARLVVSLIMLALAFVSLIIIGLHKAYWIFTCVMAGADAVLSIWLVWYVRRTRSNESPFPGKLWHMILHWIGLIAVIYLIAVFINYGVISHTEAGLFALLVLALTLYLAGIYTDTIFMLVGFVLALMAAGTILITTYLWLVMIPVIVIVALFIFVIVTRDKRKSIKDNNNTE